MNVIRNVPVFLVPSNNNPFFIKKNINISFIFSSEIALKVTVVNPTYHLLDEW